MSSSEREKYAKALNTVLSMYKDQQQVLIEERKQFKQKFQLQQDQWVADVLNFEDIISTLKSKVIEAQLDRNLAHRKMDLMLSIKKREICLLKLKLEYAESDVDDFREYVDYLVRKLSAQIEKYGGECSNRSKGKGATESNYTGTVAEEERSSKILESELEKLKRDYETLLSSLDPEVFGLLKDRNFAWNQFDKMRSDYTSFQQKQHEELAQANEKIEKLLTGMGHLESSNSEKDEIIVKLKAELAKFETDTEESKREISRLSKEVAKLRNSKAASPTPVLNACTTRSQTRGKKQQKASMDKSKSSLVRSPLNKESPGSQASDMTKKTEATEPRTRKRKQSDKISVPDAPRLFTSNFKVPKLKDASQRIA